MGMNYYAISGGQPPCTHCGRSYGIRVLHRCDNPPCCRPDHLFLGTDSDNMLDMSRKGRNIVQTHPERLPHGEAHWCRVLDDDAVRALRSAIAASESQSSVARRIGIPLATVNRAYLRRTWRHVQ